MVCSQQNICISSSIGSSNIGTFYLISFSFEKHRSHDKGQFVTWVFGIKILFCSAGTRNWKVSLLLSVYWLSRVNFWGKLMLVGVCLTKARVAGRYVWQIPSHTRKGRDRATSILYTKKEESEGELMDELE